MRLLHVVPSLDPANGGTVAVVRDMAKSMCHAGDRSEILSLVTPQPNWVASLPVAIHSLGRTLTYYQYAPKLNSWLRDNHTSYDAVIVHGVWRHPSVGIWRALRGTATPYFLFTHGMLDPWFRQAYPLKHVKKALFWKLLEHRTLRDARAVLFTSEQESRLAPRDFHPFACRTRVVGMGVSTPCGDPTEQRASFLSRFPHLRGKRLVLFLARLHRKKGCDLLIRAFESVASADPRLHLVLAGPDEEGRRGELERLAKTCHVERRVTFTGHLDGQFKWGAFRASEVFVLPSHTESYGVAVVEALACGLPALITNKVNIWREIEEEKAGLVANDDLDGTIELLHRWNSLDAGQLDVLGRNACGCFQNRFEMESFVGRFLQYLRGELGFGPSVPAADICSLRAS
jgi:glycosyltransferase involved in cell wall biosynthesis